MVGEIWSIPRIGCWSIVLEVAETQTASISMVEAAPEAIRVGKIVYAVLLTKNEEKAFSIVHLTSRGAGAAVWRLLHAEYAGSSGARLGTIVRDVVCPREQWLANASADKDFLTEWEIKIAAYEVASGDNTSDAVRVATIMDHALEPRKATLCQ